MPDVANEVTLTDEERNLLRGFVAGGSRAKIRGEWVWDTKSEALHAAVEQIIAARLASPVDGTGHADHTDPYCVTHCAPGVKHSQCGCTRSHRGTSPAETADPDA